MREDDIGGARITGGVQADDIGGARITGGVLADDRDFFAFSDGFCNYFLYPILYFITCSRILIGRLSDIFLQQRNY